MRIGLQTWGSEGDIRPFLNLAAGLSQAGHEVRLVITEVAPRDYSEEAWRGGYALEEVASPVFKDTESILRMGEEVMAASNPVAQSKVLVEYAFDPVAEQVARASVELAAWADLLIGHYFLSSIPAAAQAARIPHVSLQLSHGFVPTRFENPLGTGSHGAVINRLLWSLACWMTNRLLLGRANETRRALGAAPIHDVIRETWISSDLTLVAVSRALCARQPDWPASCRITGFLGRPTSAGENPHQLPEFPSTDGPVVFFTFGSLMPVDRESVDVTLAMWCDAARRAGVSAVMQSPLGPSFDLPERVRVIRRCDHAAVFPHCAAIVHHGGAGTTQSAIRAGVPSVVVPHVADQFFWGATMQRLRLGKVTRKRQRVTAGEIAGCLSDILGDPQIPAACSRARETALGEDGVAAAVREIESVFGNFPPTRTPA